MTSLFLVCQFLFVSCFAFCPPSTTQLQDFQSVVPIVITGTVTSGVNNVQCINKKSLQFQHSSTQDKLLVKLDCENKGQVQCIQGLEGDDCFVVVQATNEGLTNCQEKQIQIGNLYTFLLTPQEQLQACGGVYTVASTAKSPTLGITDQTQFYQRDEFGNCPSKIDSSLKATRQLLQDNDTENSTMVQCGLFAVDISYCGSDGLVTDQGSAKMVLACNSQVSGICSSCVTVEGPPNSSVAYVSNVDSSSTHFEIQVKWEPKNYEGPVKVSTDQCSLITTDEDGGAVVQPVTPMTFNSVQKVMVRPTAYRINYDL